jgi:hypothetical protein
MITESQEESIAALEQSGRQALPSGLSEPER